MRREQFQFMKDLFMTLRPKRSPRPSIGTSLTNFDSADHGAPLFNLEVPGYGALWSLCRRWTRICSLLLKERQRPS